MELANTAGRIGSKLTPVVPGDGVIARVSRSPSPSRRAIGTSHSSSGIPWPLTPAAACSSDSAPSAIRPRAALRKYVVNCALLRSSTRSRCSASGSVSVPVRLPVPRPQARSRRRESGLQGSTCLSRWCRVRFAVLRQSHRQAKARPCARGIDGSRRSRMRFWADVMGES